MKSLSPAKLAIPTLAFCFLIFSGCEDFFSKNIVMGGNLRRTGSTTSSSSSSSGGGSSPADDDNDGLSNEVERTFGLDPATADSDHDGFADGLEFVGRNGDPLSPRLTPTHFTRARILDSVASDVDSDGDGLGDTFEESNGLNPNEPDSDGDGYTDGLELIAGSSPLNSSSRPVRSSAPTSDGSTLPAIVPLDSDGDGISDDMESLNNSDSNAVDTDGDGYSDGIEFLMGSDANDSLSIPNLVIPSSSTTS